MLRLGRWEDVLADVTCDAVITDPPYGKRTHEGAAHEGGYSREALQEISYTAWDERDVRAFVESWSPRCRGWMLALTSHDLVPAWESAYNDSGRYAFAPVPCVITGMTVRLTGDGPSSWCVYAMAARPKTKEAAAWGTLPGAYVVPRHQESGNGRGKPPYLMNALIRDYSRAEDLVCDPCAGYGSTLAAALANGRRAIGSEVDPAVHAEASNRLSRPAQIDLLSAVL